MPSVRAEYWSLGAVVVPFEIDVSAAAAITATRGDDIVVTDTGVGTYTIRVVGRTFNEVLFETCTLRRAVPTVINAQITAIDLDGAGDGTGAVITVTILDDYATPVAVENSGTAATISGCVVFRGQKVSGLV